MQKHYTYSHNKPDGTSFYIGKGQGNRAYRTNDRNKYWHNIVNKYNYEVQILAYWETHEEALKHEILLISCFKDMGIELTNMTNGGEGSLNPCKETRQKMRKNNLGKILSEKTKKKISKALAGKKGKPHTEESKAKLKIAHTGKILSKETCLKMSLSRKGISHTKEHSLAISLAKKGKPCSDLTKLAISAGKKGKPWTEARILAQKLKKEKKLNVLA